MCLGGGEGPGMCRVQWFHFPSPTGQHSPWDGPTLMDPTQLSMGQGKDFLKHLGIPQRDVSVGEVGQVTCGGTSWPPSQVLMSIARAESPWLATWLCGHWPVAGTHSNHIVIKSQGRVLPPGDHQRSLLPQRPLVEVIGKPTAELEERAFLLSSFAFKSA